LTQTEQWFYRGESLLGLGNTTAARETFTEWLGREEQSLDARLGLASAELQSGNPVPAIEQLQAITADAPTHYKAWQTLAAAQTRAGQIEEAEQSLVNAEQYINLEADLPRYANILIALVETRLALRKLDDARLSLNRLSGVSPEGPATLFLSARLARVEGDYAMASRHLQKMLNITPDNVRAQLFLANVQMMQRNFAQAERLLNRVVALTPDNLQARKLLARVQLHQAQPEGAAEALAPMLDQEEEDADVFAILAEVSLQQGDVESAIRQLRSALELAPSDTSVQLNLAGAYIAAEQPALALEVLAQVPEGAGEPLRRERLQMIALRQEGKVDQADSIAESVLAAANGNERNLTVVAEYFLQSERRDRAMDILRRAVNNDAQAINARKMLARLEMSSGNVDSAHQLFTEVLSMNESDQSALLGLAQLAKQAGDGEEMTRRLTQAIEAHPTAIAPRVVLANKYLLDGNSEDAEPIVDELVVIGFVNSFVSEIVARVFEANGRFEDALNHFQQAARLDPESATVQFGLARVYLALDRSVDAREALGRALVIRPGWIPAMALLVLVEFRQGELDDASAVIADMRRLHPDSPVGMVLEGELQLLRDNYLLAAESFAGAVKNGGGRSAVLRQYRALMDADQADAESALQDWLQDEPDDVVVRRRFAEHLQLSGAGSRAVKEYERILELDPDDAAALNNIAWQYREDGDLNRAREYAERARAILPESGSVADTLGWIFFGLGQVDRSLELLSEAARLSPGNGEIQFHFAVVLSESGDKEQARRILQDLKDNNVDFSSRDEAEALLGRL
jgi:putative PEP-CTERM system TPR-repeat lipoprotein